MWAKPRTKKKQKQVKSQNLDEILENELEQNGSYRDNFTCAKLRGSPEVGMTDPPPEVTSSKDCCHRKLGTLYTS